MQGVRVIDEVQFLRAYNNLRNLIDHARTTGDAPVITDVCNALLHIAAMLDSLNQRVTELQAEGDDE